MNATKRLSVAAVVSALALLGAALFGGVADAKTKKSKPFTATKTVNLPVPDQAPGPGATSPHGLLESTISIPKKKRKNLVISPDTVKLTVTFTGADPASAEDVDFRLRSNTGRSTSYWGGFVGQNIGPLTITPNSQFLLCNELTDPCANPKRTVRPPYAGGTIGDHDLTIFDSTKMPKSMTLEVQDTGNMPGHTFTLISWALNINTAATSSK